MSNMTKTAALRAAQDSVSRPIGHGTSWRFYTPYYPSDPSGPNTEICSDGYHKMVQWRAKSVATIALHMMGVAQNGVVPGELIEWLEYMYGPMSAARFVDEAMKLNREDFVVGYDDSWCS
ncbi:MAG: hypothetical protein JNJ76_13820 [Candidatus Competibacter sp.]|nr:hypothetical protein [Candidatus Competibacter sp.]